MDETLQTPVSPVTEPGPVCRYSTGHIGPSPRRRLSWWEPSHLDFSDPETLLGTLQSVPGDESFPLTRGHRSGDVGGGHPGKKEVPWVPPPGGTETFCLVLVFWLSVGCEPFISQ